MKQKQSRDRTALWKQARPVRVAHFMLYPLLLLQERSTQALFWRSLFACLAVACLASCASLSEDQCRMGQWQKIGEADGASGQSPDRLMAHSEACADFGVTPVPEEYLAGHQRGLLYYCTSRNAVREGLAGRSYRGVCPLEVDQAFAGLHDHAYAVYRARQDVDAIERDIRDRERERRSDKTSPERRKEIGEELRRLDNRAHRARDALREQEYDLDRAARSVRF